MKIGIYNPYLDPEGLGGGERYTLCLAAHWSIFHEVDIFWNKADFRSEAQRKFNINLEKVHLVRDFFTKSKLSKIMTTFKYDILFVLSDGSIPLSLARHTIIHVQMPYKNFQVPFYKRLKKITIICNSQFTFKNLNRSSGIKSGIIYPPVDVDNFKPSKKTKTIISVGRFSRLKKHEIMIDAFKIGYKEGIFKNWKMVIAGSLLPSDKEYFHNLKVMSSGFPIEILDQITFEKLKNIYAEACFYWHAAGYGEKNPMNMEHFGISTVEAMASGAVPIVLGAGGQPEIVRDKTDGYLWAKPDELIKLTAELIADNSLVVKMSESARIRSKEFSYKKFTDSYDRYLNFSKI